MTIGKISIKPTKHYELHHSDVEWDLVIVTVLSPDKVKPSKRHGKNRFTYIKIFKEFIIELHTERDSVEDIVWVINAFKVER
ncbi:hypothetical protein JXA85_07915 [Candidatus Woesearchaeota archaeon]|nr:hypothetical protein [Candidatus Woesearchaeota archaeon]